MELRIFPPEGNGAVATVTLPLSKSESNRALVIHALTPGSTEPEVSDCDDTWAIRRALSSRTGSTVDVGPAGTAMRFLTALFATREGLTVTLDGNERMRRRPIGPLVDALRSLGAAIEYVSAEGFPPLRISGRRLTGGRVDVDASVSSQFISALMMVGPVMERPLVLNFSGVPVSQPYIRMTAALMRECGADVSELSGGLGVIVGNAGYSPEAVNRLKVSADWSAASYWYEIAALRGVAAVRLEGLRDDSLQGDRRIVELMEVQSPVERDLSDVPDLAQTLAVTYCLLGRHFRLTGLRTLRIKETDRLEALRVELAKLGYALSVPDDDTLEWHGDYAAPTGLEPIDSHGDHRMAMSFAPAAVRYPGLRIRGAETVSKSYPNYWRDLTRAGFRIEEIV
ncbi:MAG: 3-phosphoshikimate 1-carboxyvinyltransferase [Muribaculaceae bacterium]|nr:3-phosphoshikimate 1-carboxyvinyltransferase [Muribaculaceae bacterium]